MLCGVNYSFPALMFDASGGGFYRENGGFWSVYHSYANACVGIGGSTTTSGYALQVNGSMYVPSGNIYTAGDVTASTYYDTNTAYYLNPASSSVLNSVDGTFTGSINSMPKHDGTSISGMGMSTGWDPRPGPTYDRYSINWHTGISLSGYPSYGGVRLYSAGYPSLATSVLRLEASSGVYTYGAFTNDSSVTAPIFYDTNTAYYGDFASTSNIYNLTIKGIIGDGTAPLQISPVSSSGSFQWASTAVSAGLGSGQTMVHFIGNALNAGNSGYLGFQYYGANSGANFVSLGFYGNDNLLRVYNGSYTEFSGSARAPIFYDLNNTGYYVDPASRSNINLFTTADSNEFSFIGTNVATSNKVGLSWGGDSSSYAIFKPAGAWVQPMHIAFHTGLRIGAQSAYGGTRFYNTELMATQIMSVGSGDNNVRVEYDIRSPIFYDTNTSYYADPAGTSNLAYVNLASVYTGNKTSGAGVLVNTSWQEVNGLVVTGVYIQYGFSRVICTFCTTQRSPNAAGKSHGVYRIRAVSQNTGTTFYVGHASWGFGISRRIHGANDQTWDTYTQTVNLAAFINEGNSFVAGNTYSIYLEVRDASDGFWYAASEADGGFVPYTPAQMQIWVS
jgi:hypothetical protein